MSRNVSLASADYEPADEPALLDEEKASPPPATQPETEVEAAPAPEAPQQQPLTEDMQNSMNQLQDMLDELFEKARALRSTARAAAFPALRRDTARRSARAWRAARADARHACRPDQEHGGGHAPARAKSVRRGWPALTRSVAQSWKNS